MKLNNRTSHKCTALPLTGSAAVSESGASVTGDLLLAGTRSKPKRGPAAKKHIPHLMVRTETGLQSSKASVFHMVCNEPVSPPNGSKLNEESENLYSFPLPPFPCLCRGFCGHEFL